MRRSRSPLGLLALLLPLVQGTWVRAGSDTPPPAASPYLNRHYEDASPGPRPDRFEGLARGLFDHRFRIVHELGIHPGMRIADIGAGTGIFTVLLARATGPDGLVYAVGTSSDSIADIEARAAEYRVQNVVPLVSDRSSTDLDPGGIDLAFLCESYRQLEDPEAMLRSIRRALVPYGLLVIVDRRHQPGIGPAWVAEHSGVDPERVIQEVQSAGYRLLDEPELPGQGLFLRFQRREDE